MVKIKWTKLSVDDLGSIKDYIAQDSKKYAIITIRKFQKRAQDLKSFPRKGRIVPEIENPNIRELIVGNYRLVYRIVDEDLIHILRVQSSYKQLHRESLEWLLLGPTRAYDTMASNMIRMNSFYIYIGYTGG